MITEGSNLSGMHALADELVDLDRVTSNDVYALLTTYGVEAARKAIIDEVSSVFGAYAIAVDYRHLTIIADYMVSCRTQRPGGLRLMFRRTQEDTDHSTERVYPTNRHPCSKRRLRRQFSSWRKRCYMVTLTI